MTDKSCIGPGATHFACPCFLERVDFLEREVANQKLELLGYIGATDALQIRGNAYLDRAVKAETALIEVRELSEWRLKSEQKYAWGSLEFTNEIKKLRAELATNDGIAAKQNAHMNEEISKLKAELANITEDKALLRVAYEVEKAKVSKLKAELETVRSLNREFIHNLESRAAKYRTTLEIILAQDPEGLGDEGKLAKEALREHCYTGLIDCHTQGPHHHNENDPSSEAKA